MSIKEISGLNQSPLFAIHGNESSSTVNKAVEMDGESDTTRASRKSSSTAEQRSDVTQEVDRAYKTYIKQLPMECFVSEYHDADFDLKAKNAGTHLRARVQATFDFVEGALITLIATVQAVGTFAFSLGLLAVTKIANHSAAVKVEKFFGAKIDPKQRWEVLKRAAVGTGHSLYAIGSPIRAIHSAEKSKHVGTTERLDSRNNFGTAYNPFTRERHHALSANFWPWGGYYLKA